MATSSHTRGSTAWRAEAWGDPCGISPAAVEISPGAPKCQVRRELVPAVHALGRVLEAFGYPVRRIGGYNCRKITGTTNSWSAHAYGLAVDINDDTNPYRLDRLVTDMSPAMIRAVLEIRTVGGAPVWRWGGDWDGRPDTPHSNYDAMHFECVATPEELAQGIAGLAPTPVPDIQPATVHSFPVLQRGDTGTAVLFFQELMGMTNLGGGAGQFGPRTEQAAVAYQRSRGLEADGVVGLATWTALLSAAPEIQPGQPTPQKRAVGAVGAA